MIGTLVAEMEIHERFTLDQIVSIEAKPFGSECSAEFAEFAQVAAHIPPRSRVIEFGCGDGWLLGLLAQAGHFCLGIDCNAHWIDRATQRWLNTEFRCGTWNSAWTPRNDVVIWNSSLHHAPDMRAALESSYGALRPGGLLLVCEPGLGHSLRPSTRLWHKKMRVTERDTPPIKTVLVGLVVGFRKPRVYPNLNTLARVNRSRFPALATMVLALGKWAHGFVVMRKPG